MATNSHFKVIFHYELNGKVLHQYGFIQAHVTASDTSPATLNSALSNTYTIPSGATRVFDSVASANTPATVS
jgi:hypothetical protein